MELKIDLKISPKIKKLFDQPEEIMHKSIWAGMVNLVEEIEARATDEAPVKTSNLRRRIVSSVSADGRKGVVTSQAPYSEYVHEGTGIYGPFKTPFRIFAKNKKALFWPGAAHPWRSVPHKGQKPNPFFTRALQKIKPQRVFENGVAEYLKQFGGGGGATLLIAVIVFR